MSALNIYLTLITLNVLVTFFMYARFNDVTRRQVVINVVSNATFVALGYIMPSWLLNTLSVLMVISLAYAGYVIYAYGAIIVKKSNVIEEEFHVSDLDPNDELSASILRAWERAQRD
jgi:glucan phosphoethanolaminetransferase (alkaline phosphatase superfamily)